eukprot:jgi/Botrbrau1/11712/Bobra.0195s0040.1
MSAVIRARQETSSSSPSTDDGGEFSSEEDSSGSECTLGVRSKLSCSWLMHSAQNCSKSVLALQEAAFSGQTFEEQDEARRTGLSTGVQSSQKIKKGRLSTRLKRSSKNEPQILSSKFPVSRYREALQVPRRRHTDPRFTKMRGGESNTVFRKQYAFLYDENMPAEKQDLKKALKKAQKPESKEALQANLTRLQQSLSAEKARRDREAWEAQQKANLVTAAKQGRKPFYLKRSEKSRQELVRRYNMLKDLGRLDKVIAKKARKNASKDHRYVPAKRRIS